MLNIRDQIRKAMATPPRTIQLETFRLASVAAILTPEDKLLFMQRAVHESDPWSGHLSFPGGRKEPNDIDDISVAIRETHEEIGLDLNRAEHIGRLDDLRTLQPLPPILIRPHLFFVNEPLSVVLNNEADSLHFLSMHDLLNGTGRGVMEHPWRGVARRFPCVRFDGVCLWGLTLHMVDDLLHRLDGRGRGLERLENHQPVDPNTFDNRDAESWRQ